MNPLRLEAKRFLYSLWMLPAVLLVTSGLVCAVYRGGTFPQPKEPITCLALLLSSAEYHILLYGVLAVALVGVDVSGGIPRLETLAGVSPLRFLRRKAILYVTAVLLCELTYLLVPLSLWPIPWGQLLGSYTPEGAAPPILWLFPARLLLDLGIAAPFFLLQTALPGLQAMLIADAAGAVLWIGLHEDDLEAWFMALLGYQGLPGHWLMLAGASIALSFLLSFGILRLQTRK